MDYKKRIKDLNILFSNTRLLKHKNILPVFGILLASIFTLSQTPQVNAAVATNITLPWSYTFNTNGVLNEASSPDLSGSPYWWVSSGGQLIVSSGMGKSLSGFVPTSNKWNISYSKSNPTESDNGSHPQNLFSLFQRSPQLNSDQQITVKIKRDNLTNTANRNPWNGILLFSRWQNNNNYYYAGLREDGKAIIKKKVNGIYYTLAESNVLAGTWNAVSNPSLLPKDSWIKIRNVTRTNSNGNVHIQLYTDMNQSGKWELILETTDNSSNGPIITTSGLPGIKTNFMDVEIDNYKISNPSSIPTLETPAPQIITSSPLINSTSTPNTPPVSNSLFTDSFSSYPNGVITNEYAYWNKNDPNSRQSTLWELDSGSLFASGGVGWTGIPDSIAPNTLSTNGNNSAVFRLVTKPSNFGNVSVKFDMLNQGLTSTASTPSVSWDGFHIFLRYQSQYNLYYISVNRRDNTVVIKKKVPGGPSNNGTYYELSRYTAHTVPYNVWQNINATVKNNTDGSVTLELYSNGTLLTRAVDNGTIGGAPIRNSGKVGIRGDNANLKIKNFNVTSI